MELEDLNGYLLLALIECDQLHDDSADNPDQALAELEHIIHEALNKVEQLKN